MICSKNLMALMSFDEKQNKNTDMKRFAICLIWERSENNELKRLSKLVANVDAKNQEEAIGIVLIKENRLFENWRLAAALAQEQNKEK